jgi:hypothetical protein
MAPMRLNHRWPTQTAAATVAIPKIRATARRGRSPDPAARRTARSTTSQPYGAVWPSESVLARFPSERSRATCATRIAGRATGSNLRRHHDHSSSRLAAPPSRRVSHAAGDVQQHGPEHRDEAEHERRPAKDDERLSTHDEASYRRPLFSGDEEKNDLQGRFSFIICAE